MRKRDSNIDAFYALVRAGLWERAVQLLPYGVLNYSFLHQLAEEQSVVGLLAAGLEYVSDTKVAKKDVLPFIGATLQLEQRNQAMNYFIGVIVEKMREEGIYSLLVKGQGIAQCYIRPLWRASGDIDFLLDEENYEKAKTYLTPLASHVDVENNKAKHLGMTIDPWIVELHGRLHNHISKKSDALIDRVQYDSLVKGSVRSWRNEATDIFLPSPDNDVVIVFSHILQHFFRGGIGLRQICDWCRLLWTFRDSIDRDLLEARIREMGMMVEWKAFSAYVVDYLGMPVEAMPMYNADSNRYNRKASRISSFILEVGNFGHKRDNSFYAEHSYVVAKIISLRRHFGDFCRHFLIFPRDSLRVFWNTIRFGVQVAARGD